MEIYGKKKVEIPVRKVAKNILKTTQTDVPTTSEKKRAYQKKIIEQVELSNLSMNPTSFNIENELEKLKILIPLTELMNKNMYRPQVMKALNIGENTNSVSLNNDQPKLLFGLEVEGKQQEGGVPPFYVNLNIHDKILHNSMLDSGTSHNYLKP